MQKADLVFVLDQTDRAADHSLGNEVVLSFSLADHAQNFSGGLIEGFDGGEDITVRQRQGLAQDAFGAALINVPSEDLAAKFAVHDDLAGSGGRIWLSIVGLAEAQS